MKIFVLFLIAVVGCCLCESSNDDRRCKLLKDVAESATLISQDTPSFAVVVMNQVKKRAQQAGLANTRSFFQPFLGLIRKLLGMLEKVLSFEFSNGDNILVIGKNAIFKALHAVAGDKLKHVLKVAEPIVSLIVSTVNELVKSLLPELLKMLAPSE